jgi:hypothetical protein
VQAAVRAAPYPVEILPPDPARAARCLAALEVTTRSWLGAVTANCAGILVDHGWLRVLGSGGDGLPDLMAEADPAAGRLVVGHDILGGQFSWHPARRGKPPTIHYFAPDELRWTDLGQGYGDWLSAFLQGAMTPFYRSMRWPGWEAEVAALARDQGIHTWPPPWSGEGKDLATASRKAIPIAELVAFHHEMARQLGE